MVGYRLVQEEKKEKRTPVYLYRYDCEPVGLTFIMFNRDVVQGLMPLLRSGL